MLQIDQGAERAAYQTGGTGQGGEGRAADGTEEWDWSGTQGGHES